MSWYEFCRFICISRIIVEFRKIADRRKFFAFETNLPILQFVYNFNSCSRWVVNVKFGFRFDWFFLNLCWFVYKAFDSSISFLVLDVYEGSPNTTTFFFAVIPKISLFVLLMRLCYISFYQLFVDDFQIYFFGLAVLSIFVGALGGIEQRKLKTLILFLQSRERPVEGVKFSVNIIFGICL